MFDFTPVLGILIGVALAVLITAMIIMVSMRLRRPTEGTAAPHVVPPDDAKGGGEMESKPLSGGSVVPSRLKDSASGGAHGGVGLADSEDNDPDVIPHNTGEWSLLTNGDFDKIGKGMNENGELRTSFRNNDKSRLFETTDTNEAERENLVKSETNDNLTIGRRYSKIIKDKNASKYYNCETDKVINILGSHEDSSYKPKTKLSSSEKSKSGSLKCDFRIENEPLINRAKEKLDISKIRRNIKATKDTKNKNQLERPQKIDAFSNEPETISLPIKSQNQLKNYLCWKKK